MFVNSCLPAEQAGMQAAGRGAAHRDPLGSPSAAEGGEVKPQMLDVINTLRLAHVMSSDRVFPEIPKQTRRLHMTSSSRNYRTIFGLGSRRTALRVSEAVCVCVFSFRLLGLVCVFTWEEHWGVTEVERAASHLTAQQTELRLWSQPLCFQSLCLSVLISLSTGPRGMIHFSQVCVCCVEHFNKLICPSVDRIKGKVDVLTMSVRNDSGFTQLELYFWY